MAPSNGKSEETMKAPSLTDTKNDNLIHRTSTLIQKGLCSALTPRPRQLRISAQTVCVMCGKVEPPERSDKEKVFWLGCSNAKKCHVRAHEKCLRAARARCFICHAGTWVKALVREPGKRRPTGKLVKISIEPKGPANTKSSDDDEAITDVGYSNKGDEEPNNEKSVEPPAGKPTDERSPALCEVNS